jgi:1-phosphofructokinase
MPHRPPHHRHPLVLALNPAVDAEWRVDRIRWDEKNVLESESRWAGGKGINVARWLRHLGGNPRVIIPLGGATGDEMSGQLDEQRIAARIITLAEPSRVNVMVTQHRGPQLRFNQPGPRLSRAEWTRVFAAARAELPCADPFIISGSLPRLAPVDTYARMTAAAHRARALTLLDCDGPALPPALAQKPFLVKPNEFELAQWAGREISGDAEILRAAQQMSETTDGWVLVSRAADGGLLVNAHEQHVSFARIPRVRARNTVGAGDSLLAAVALQIGAGTAPDEWLRHGVATATAAVQMPAGTLAPRSLIASVAKRIRIERR